MTKARNIADLLDANGDVKSASLDNVPASNDASALTTGTLPNARLPDNISDGGTTGTKLASGTTAQRGSTAGQIRFNSTTGLAEYYTGTAFKSIDAPPTVTSLDVTEVDSQAGGNQTIVITGSGFNSGATVIYIGASGTNFNASTVTVNSDTQITAVAPKASFLNAQEPYGVKVTNTTSLSATLTSQINVDSSPAWSTASGSLGNVTEGASANITVSAADPDGDTVAYSETTSVLSGAGFSLNSSTGAITGTANTVSADTTNTFTLRATANTKTADRQFNIITKNQLAWDILGGITSSGGNAMNSEASYMQVFFDPSDTRSYSGSGTSITNMAWDLGVNSRESGGETWSLTNTHLAGSGSGKYFVNNSSGSQYIRAPNNPAASWSNGTNDQLAFCGWWYGKQDFDSTGTIWIFNDGDWSPNAQVGIRVQSGGIRTHRGSSSNIFETLPSKSYANKWTFWCGYMGTRPGYYTGVGFATDTNLTTIVEGGHSYNTGTSTHSPFTIGARPDSLSEGNASGTRMGFQAVWGAADDAFLSSSGNYANSDGRGIFEQIFDQTKGFYS